jgi:hypothetical protein
MKAGRTAQHWLLAQTAQQLAQLQQCDAPGNMKSKSDHNSLSLF